MGVYVGLRELFVFWCSSPRGGQTLEFIAWVTVQLSTRTCLNGSVSSKFLLAHCVARLCKDACATGFKFMLIWWISIAGAVYFGFQVWWFMRTCCRQYCRGLDAKHIIWYKFSCISVGEFPDWLQENRALRPSTFSHASSSSEWHTSSKNRMGFRFDCHSMILEIWF